MLNKRGAEEGFDEYFFIYLFYVILSVIIGFILISFALSLKDDTAFRMKSNAIDTALLIDATYLSKNDFSFEVDYKEPFSMNIEQNPCIVKTSKDFNVNTYSYRCFSLEDYSNTNMNLEEGKLKIEKKKGELLKIE